MQMRHPVVFWNQEQNQCRRMVNNSSFTQRKCSSAGTNRSGTVESGGPNPPKLCSRSKVCFGADLELALITAESLYRLAREEPTRRPAPTSCWIERKAYGEWTRHSLPAWQDLDHRLDGPRGSRARGNRSQQATRRASPCAAHDRGLGGPLLSAESESWADTLRPVWPQLP